MSKPSQSLKTHSTYLKAEDLGVICEQNIAVVLPCGLGGYSARQQGSEELAPLAFPASFLALVGRHFDYPATLSSCHLAAITGCSSSTNITSELPRAVCMWLRSQSYGQLDWAVKKNDGFLGLQELLSLTSFPYGKVLKIRIQLSTWRSHMWVCLSVWVGASHVCDHMMKWLLAA